MGYIEKPDNLKKSDTEVQSTLICPKCGEENLDNARICKNCHKVLKFSTNSRKITEEHKTYRDPIKTPYINTRLIIWSVIIAAVIGSIISFITIMFFYPTDSYVIQSSTDYLIYTPTNEFIQFLILLVISNYLVIFLVGLGIGYYVNVNLENGVINSAVFGVLYSIVNFLILIEHLNIISLITQSVLIILVSTVGGAIGSYIKKFYNERIIKKRKL